MVKVIDSEFMRLVQKTSLHLAVNLKNNKLGKKRSNAKGSSVEFSDYRTYLPGDDYRRIDWNALARFEKAFIKLYMEEQEAPITLFVDQSKSMDFAGKRETSIKTAAFFAYASLDDYDSVTLVCHTDKINIKRTGIRGISSFYQVAAMLEKNSYQGGSALYDCVMPLQSRFKKGTTVIISDLLYDCDLARVLSLLRYKKQQVILCHILSPQEREPYYEQGVSLKDSETQTEIDIDGGAYAMQLYQKHFNTYIGDIKKLVEKYNINYLQIDAEKGIDSILQQIVKRF